MAFYGQGGGAAFDPIDCWVAQTAREMLDAGDWIVPRFAGQARMQKSPGPYWAVMATSVIAGRPIDEATARVPNALAAIALVATIYWLARRIAGDRAAVFAGFAASSSVLILWWSHRAASDLGLTLWTTLSLGLAWVALERERPGLRQTLMLLSAYLAAGVGMLWKMPMPLVVVGLPAVAYVVVLRRWSLLARWQHVLGIGLFLLPWLPWVIAVTGQEPGALAKWRVEFVDRYTGDLPNVAGQDRWYHWLLYLGPLAWYCVPYTLSLPAACSWAFRPRPHIDLRGVRLMLIWAASLFVFLTLSAGKEERYFLPGLPPMFVLLGIELASLFDDRRDRSPMLAWIAALKTWIIVPAALIGGGLYGMHEWWVRRGQFEIGQVYDWIDVRNAFVIAALVISIGLGFAAWLYLRRRRGAAFAALVGTMYLMWMWAWPKLMPLVMSQRPFIEFAERLADPRIVPPGQRSLLRNVGTHEPRIIWYSDVRFGRLIDQLELLEEQGGRRSLEYEVRRYGEEITKCLAAPEPVLLVASAPDFLMYLARAPEALEAEGRSIPPLHLWLQTRSGTMDRQMVLFGNRKPPFDEPAFVLPEPLSSRQKAKGLRMPPWSAP